MKRLTLVFSAFILAVVPACESDGDSNSGTNGSGTSGADWSTGLDGSLALSELTDEQQLSACEASGEYLENWEAENADMMKRADCYISTSFAVSFRMDIPEGSESEFDCQEHYDQCVDPAPREETDKLNDAEEESQPCADPLKDFSECTEVTVADLETCSLARLEILYSWYEILAAGTCQDIAASAQSEGPDDLMAGMPNMEEVPECVEVEEKCAALQLSGESSGSGSDTANLPGEPCTDDADCEVEPYCDGDTSMEPLNPSCLSITGTCDVVPVVGTQCPDGCADGVCVGGNVPEPEDEETPPQEPEPSDS
jgi:hypothetical protein